MSDTKTRERTLAAADRCDRCGAQAYVHARVLAGGELLLCAHHGTANQSVLDDTERVEILADDREWLLQDEEATV